MSDRVVYLIERIPAMQINGQATYWSGDDELPPGGETTNPWDACWFPRMQDAARVACGKFGKNLTRSGWHIVEHLFSNELEAALTAVPSELQTSKQNLEAANEGIYTGIVKDLFAALGVKTRPEALAKIAALRPSAKPTCPHDPATCDYPRCVDMNSGCLVAQIEWEAQAVPSSPEKEKP